MRSQSGAAGDELNSTAICLYTEIKLNSKFGILLSHILRARSPLEVLEKLLPSAGTQSSGATCLALQISCTDKGKARTQPPARILAWFQACAMRKSNCDQAGCHLQHSSESAALARATGRVLDLNDTIAVIVNWELGVLHRVDRPEIEGKVRVHDVFVWHVEVALVSPALAP